MPSLTPPDRTPEARVTVQSGESTTDALVRAAKQADIDLTGSDVWVQDLVEGHALDRLFLDRDPDADDGRATLLLELWGHVFVLTPTTVEVYP